MTAGPRPAARALLAGGAALAVAQTVASAGNYVLNLFLGRWMDPPAFADASIMVTLMLLASAGTLGIQLVTARAVALSGEDAPVRRLGRIAVGAGIALGAVLVIGAPVWHRLLHTESTSPFVLLALGFPAYLAAAVGRGRLQGMLRFGPLAASYVVEMLVRVLLSLGLVAAGFGVPGATIGLSVSFVATWAAVLVSGGRPPARDAVLPGGNAELRRYGAQTGVLLAGQIVANNADVLIAKYALNSDLAARYAAVALVGRAVFFLTWSVTVTVFPMAARQHAEGEQDGRLLRVAGAAVLSLGLACTVAAALAGGPVLAVVLGPHYGGLSLPLAGYALATTMLSIANLVASHHLAIGQVRQAWIVLAGAVTQTVVLGVRHSSITEFVVVQIVCMSALVAVVEIDRRRPLPLSGRPPTAVPLSPLSPPHSPKEPS